jgi:hypothetical protein
MSQLWKSAIANIRNGKARNQTTVNQNLARQRAEAFLKAEKFKEALKELTDFVESPEWEDLQFLLEATEEEIVLARRYVGLFSKSSLVLTKKGFAVYQQSDRSMVIATAEDALKEYIECSGLTFSAHELLPLIRIRVDGLAKQFV